MGRMREHYGARRAHATEAGIGPTKATIVRPWFLGTVFWLALWPAIVLSFLGMRRLERCRALT